MVRTKADRVPTRATGSKAPGKVKTVSSTTKVKQRKISYNNQVHRAHPRETPKWQKPITSFIDRISKTTENEATTSKEKIENQDPNPNVEEESTDEDSN